MSVADGVRHEFPIGYDGPVTPEPFVPELAALPPEEAARRAGEALLKVWSVPPRVPR